MLARRSFILGVGAAATGLIIPYEPKVIYSFPSEPRIEFIPMDEAIKALKTWVQMLDEQGKLKPEYYQKVADTLGKDLADRMIKSEKSPGFSTLDALAHTGSRIWRA